MTESEFFDPRTHGFARVAVAVPRNRVADPAFNAAETIAMYREAAAQGVAVVAFPELGLSAYTCDDLFHQAALLDGCRAALAQVAEASRALGALAIVGLPLVVDHRLFNCAAVVGNGRVLGVLPKTYLPNYGEFYEARQFAARPRRCRRRSCCKGTTCPSAPTCCSARASARCWRSMWRSAKTSGCRFRRRATPRSRARRCWSTCRPPTSPWASRTTGSGWWACSPRAARRPTCTARRASANRPPTWRGTARR
jgi:hypothetical protein